MQQPTGRAPPTASMAYAVGDLVVDVSRAQVTRAGIEVPLPRLSFDFLVALIEAAPSVLSLDALMDRVWAGVVVSPETVSQRAKLLRDALGDHSKSPQYFTSVRGRGYRLVAAVKPLAAEPAASPATPRAGAALEAVSPPVPAPPPLPAPHRTPWRIALSLGLVVIVASALWLIAARTPAPVVTSGPPMGVAVPERSIAVLPFRNTGTSRASDALAFGIAEAVLHQLANLQGVVVIARASSFALGAEPGDARAVGRRLNVRFMLEGSVQQAGEQMRVTAQLIDTQTGAHVWSIRFDKPVGDVFAVQDEIAAQVAEALQLSVRPDAAAHIAGQGTTKFDAYLAYMQGRSLLATGRIGDGAQAIANFEEALRLDPAFAAAEVSLAEAELFVAEFGNAEGRAQRFERAARRASEAIERALALEPRFGPAYLLRGYLEAFSDLDRAEASYRRGLQLRPNDARGFAGLATVLFEKPQQREEALRMLERARRLDPLEPANDVLKAIFLLYDRGDVEAAEDLLDGVLQRQPQFLPALIRRGELAWCCRADASAAIEWLEQALRIDPTAQWPRRLLVRAYLDARHFEAARDVVEGSSGARAILQVPLLAYQGDWRHAGEAAYTSLDESIVSPVDELAAVIAIRRHARLTGEYERAIAELDTLAGIGWRDDNIPSVPQRPGLRSSSLGLADMLQAAGQHERANALIDRLVAQMTAEMRAPGRSETWYCYGMAVALALQDQPERALDWLRRGVEIGALGHDESLVLQGDPAFDALRTKPGFIALQQGLRAHADREAAELAQLRAQGKVPARP